MVTMMVPFVIVYFFHTVNPYIMILYILYSIA